MRRSISITLVLSFTRTGYSQGYREGTSHTDHRRSTFAVTPSSFDAAARSQPTMTWAEKRPLHGVDDRAEAVEPCVRFSELQTNVPYRFKYRRSPSLDVKSGETCAKPVWRGKLASYEPFPFHSPPAHPCPRVRTVCRAPDCPANGGNPSFPRAGACPIMRGFTRSRTPDHHQCH